MKKLIALAAAAMMLLSLFTACGKEPAGLWLKRFRQRSCRRQFCFVRADHRYGLLHVFQ